MKIVATNGVFSFLHAGHVAYLKAARQLGDRLIVGVNDDAGAKELKGTMLQSEDERAMAVAELRCVDEVRIFSGTSAARFLESVGPNIYVKGGDYTIESLDSYDLVILDRMKTIIAFIPIRHKFHCADFKNNPQKP